MGEEDSTTGSQEAGNGSKMGDNDSTTGSQGAGRIIDGAQRVGFSQGKQGELAQWDTVSLLLLLGSLHDVGSMTHTDVIRGDINFTRRDQRPGE